MPNTESYNRHVLKKDGRYPQWSNLLDRVRDIETGWWLDGDVVCAGHTQDLHRDQLHSLLTELIPWRKGPWRLAGIDIDSEWQGGVKWARVANHLDLTDRRCLDVGAGNGYFGWRMLAGGAASVTACDPTTIFVMQHTLIQKLAQEPKHAFYGSRLETLPHTENNFDVVFSMGVLSHRRYEQGDHRAHLGYLTRRLVPNGVLLLETLVVPDEACVTTDRGDRVLLPQERYARMKNVYALPSIETLFQWIESLGYCDLELLDLSETSWTEQRATAWMPYQSLVDGLSQTSSHLTIEGYPRPKRAMVLARLGSGRRRV